MNSTSWLSYYEQNRLNRPEPEWNAPCQIPDNLRQTLAVSLSHFQLGETGGGSFLLREASKESDANDLAALQLYVLEESAHAGLLAGLVQRLGGTLVHRHWTHRVFKLARHAGGFRFEIQMLLTAEIVGTAYYELVNAGVDDVAVNTAIGLMLRDETSHIAFHSDRLRLRWRSYLPFERALWSFQFQVLVLTALRAAWLDHRPCLQALGYSWQDFSTRGRQLTIQFLDGLESPTDQNLAHPIAKPMTGTLPA